MLTRGTRGSPHGTRRRGGWCRRSRSPAGKITPGRLPSNFTNGAERRGRSARTSSAAEAGTRKRGRPSLDGPDGFRFIITRKRTMSGSNTNERSFTSGSELTSNEWGKDEGWRCDHKAGRSRKAVPLLFFDQSRYPQIEITLFKVNIDFQELFGVICDCFYMSVVQCENNFLFLSCRASGRHAESVFALS